MKVGNITIFEQGPGEAIYISPEINGNDFTNVPAIWIFNDGEIHIYTKRKKTGAVLGKPIKVKGPKHEHTFAEENSKTYRPCLGCGREFKTMFPGKKTTSVPSELIDPSVDLKSGKHLKQP